MYLQEMGSVPLLSREEEVTIAKEIESGLHEVRDCVYGIPLGYRYIGGLADRLKAGEIEPRDIFADETEEEKSSVERDEKRIKDFMANVAVLKRLGKSYESYMPTHFAPSEAKTKRKPTARDHKFDGACQKVREHLIEMALGEKHVNAVVGKLKEAQDLARERRRVIQRYEKRTRRDAKQISRSSSSSRAAARTSSARRPATCA
jgi:hypothetical protein